MNKNVPFLHKYLRIQKKYTKFATIFVNHY